MHRLPGSSVLTNNDSRALCTVVVWLAALSAVGCGPDAYGSSDLDIKASGGRTSSPKRRRRAGRRRRAPTAGRRRLPTTAPTRPPSSNAASRAPRAEISAGCSKREADRSVAFKQAIHECAPDISCDGRFSSDDTCVAAALLDTEPSASQRTLADDFCAACAGGAKVVLQSGLACAGNVKTGVRTLGPAILSLSDDAAKRAERCIAPARAEYPDDYDNCENVFLNCLND